MEGKSALVGWQYNVIIVVKFCFYFFFIVFFFFRAVTINDFMFINMQK